MPSTVRDRREAEVARLVGVLRRAQDARSSKDARWWVLVTVSQLNTVLHAPASPPRPEVADPRSVARTPPLERGPEPRREDAD